MVPQAHLTQVNNVQGPPVNSLQVLPPPVDIQGKVVCRGKFDFKSVSGGEGRGGKGKEGGRGGEEWEVEGRGKEGREGRGGKGRERREGGEEWGVEERGKEGKRVDRRGEKGEIEEGREGEVGTALLSCPSLLQDDPEDLNFRKGDVMTVLRKDEDDWWYARHSDGRVGSIPVPYVEVVSGGAGHGGM